MASDGPGKYRERKSRSSKPYDRPKGIIRRVTDSVTGLFSASWLSGWMGGEDDEEGSDQPTGSSQTSTAAPAGESFIFAQPITARRPFRPIYPEEGETEANSQQSLGVNEGASTSSGIRMSVPTPSSVGISTTTTSRSLQLSRDTLSPSLMGRRYPIISSTPAPMFTARSKSQMEPCSLPLHTASMPTGDDGSEVSESSADTGIDASVIPRPDEREYQREILQLDDESLQTLRDSLAKSVPAASVVQSGTLPSLEETRKRPRDMEPDHTSVRAEGSISSKSLFSETSDIGLGQPQPSGIASKRPRFNASIYGSICLGEKSVLSDSTFKSSPFYPGKTMYGGASTYRSRRLQSHTPNQTQRAQVRAKAAPDSKADGGLSQAARRILESLEQMSTPISDAKRIPTHTPGQRGSFLDATPSYTAAFHRHRPVLRPSAPPTSRLLTPTKLTVQENLTSLLPSSSASTPGSHAFKKRNNSQETSQPVSDVTGSEKEEMNSENISSENCSSLSSKAAIDTTAKLKPIVTSVSSTDDSSNIFEFGRSSNSSTSQNTFEFNPRSAISRSSFTSDLLQAAKKSGGKIKSKIADNRRSSYKHDETVEDPHLPAVSLTMPSLPKINLSILSPVQGSPAKLSTLPEGFKFSTPEIVDIQSDSETLTSAPKFTFRNPALIGEGNLSGDDLGTTATPTILMFNSSSPNLGPKLKANNKKTVLPLSEKLKEGSILEILKPKGNNSDKLSSLSSPSNNLEGKEVETPHSQAENRCGVKYISKLQFDSEDLGTKIPQAFQGFGSAFKKSSDEWDCSVCMIRNKNSNVKCVACKNQRPGQCVFIGTAEVTTSAANVWEKSLPLSECEKGWGDAFKKSANEWECGICMLRNADSTEKCVACEAPKPGSKGVCDISCKAFKTVDNKEEKINSGFGSAFAKGKDEWECDTCLVRNKSDAIQCISCETPKPGAANVSKAITGNFRFDVNTNDLSSTSSSFKFSLSNSQTQVKSSGFNFGVSAKSAEDSDSKENSGFKFGVPAEKPNALTGLSSNSTSEIIHTKEKSQCASGFTFGVQPLNSKDSEVTNKEPSLFPLSKSSESSSEPATVTNPVYHFDTGNKTQVAFSFGSGTINTTAKNDQDKPVSNDVNLLIDQNSGNHHDPLVQENVSKSSDTFSFKSNSSCADAGVDKPTFTFNNVISAPEKDNLTNLAKNATPLSFGAPKIVDLASDACAPNFGANVGGSAATSGMVFAFGDKVAKTTAPSSFSFTSTVSNKEETKSLPTFTFKSKRESSDTSEPAKKISFGAANTCGINNGVGSSPSLFTFGSKESKINAGSGFGAVPSSTPAFGAPAPASNATPNFQFGNSNPPPPAETAPAPAFGNPASAFGSATPSFGTTTSTTNNKNNSSSATFAFGQSADKKPSAGFDFGQAASNAGSQNFNFSSGGTQPTPNIYLFGQSQPNNTPSGLFTFGTNSEVSSPASTFGNSENPFNTPAPPSGRVVKKAVRRARK